MERIRKTLIVFSSVAVLLCGCSKQEQPQQEEVTSEEIVSTESTLEYEHEMYSETENTGKFRLCLYFLNIDYSEIQGAVAMVKNGDSTQEYTTGVGGDVDIKNIDETKETTISLFDSSDGRSLGSVKIKIVRGEKDENQNGEKGTPDEGTVTYTVKEGADCLYSNLIVASGDTFKSISIN